MFLNTTTCNEVENREGLSIRSLLDDKSTVIYHFVERVCRTLKRFSVFRRVTCVAIVNIVRFEFQALLSMNRCEYVCLLL